METRKWNIAGYAGSYAYKKGDKYNVNIFLEIDSAFSKQEVLDKISYEYSKNNRVVILHITEIVPAINRDEELWRKMGGKYPSNDKMYFIPWKKDK